MKRYGWLTTLLLLISSVAFAADRDVKAVTKAIENQYGVKHKGLPWIARIVMKPALWGSGVKLDISMFEDLPRVSVKGPDMDTVLRSALNPEWSRFIRSESRRTGKRAVIYVRTVGDKFEMMIASIEPDEAVVLKLRLKRQEMKKWMDEPDEMVFHHHDHGTTTNASNKKSRDFVRTGDE